MTTILDLPDEIRILIAKHLSIRSLYSCILTCRIFNISFTPHLWSDINLINPNNRMKTISSTHVSANAHHIESVAIYTTQTEEYYHLVFPRLRTLHMRTFLDDSRDENYLVVKPPLKVLFMLSHPFVRKLVYLHNDVLPKEFWEAVGKAWTQLECLEFSSTVERDAEDAFWRVCDRVQELSLVGVGLSENSVTLSMLSTLNFQHLRQLTVNLRLWQIEGSYWTWPLQLFERVKRSPRLRRLDWNVGNAKFPVQMVVDAFAEGCWPELCELRTESAVCSDDDLARTLRMLTSRRLTYFERSYSRFGPSTFACLRETYFDQLRELDVGKCSGVTSAMVQEVMTGCTHLISIDAPHVFVRDIASASKPWACLGLEKLVLYFAKQEDDEPEWEGTVFDQIAMLRRLLVLNLKRDPHCSLLHEEPRPGAIMNLQTLDLRLPRSGSSNFVDTPNNGGDIRCWSSLVQLQELSFDCERHKLGLDELVWMTEHWPDLRCVYGGFRGVWGAEERAQRDCILRQAEIIAPKFY